MPSRRRPLQADPCPQLAAPQRCSRRAETLCRPSLAARHAGASLVQVYSSLAYGGPAVVPRMKRELAACLQRDGFASVAAAVGADHRK